MGRRWVGALVMIAAACSSSEDEDDIPDGLRIAVEIDGRRADPIDPGRLRELEPHYTKGEARAWRLSALLGSSYHEDGTILEVRGGGGETRTYSNPGEGSEGEVLALMLNRRDEPVVLAVPPQGPLPVAHGQGGQKTPSPERVHHVTRLRLYHAGRADTAPRSGAEPEQAP